MELLLARRVEDIVTAGNDHARCVYYTLLPEIFFPDGLPAADIVAEAALDAVLGVLDDDIRDRLRA